MAGWAQATKVLETANLDGDIQDWSDLKVYDDDHDESWFEEENLRLEEKFGGPFVKVKYTSQGKPGYFCELCSAEMNAEASLISHCHGMKHLKKRDQWEKEQRGEMPEEILFHQSSNGRGGGWGGPSANGPPPNVYMPDQRPNPRPRPQRRAPSPTRQPDLRQMLPTPRMARPPASHPDIPPLREDPTLNMSTTEKLLYKLKGPCIQSGDDAELALGVLCSLAKSLKEYNRRENKNKVSELLMEIELKYSTVKALTSMNDDSAFCAARTESLPFDSNRTHIPEYNMPSRLDFDRREYMRDNRQDLQPRYDRHY